LFATLLALQDCDDCRGDYCHEPTLLTTKGVETHKTHHPDAIAHWPGCPSRWDRVRKQGSEYLRLADVIAWSWELGHHRHPLLPAGKAALMRRWFHLRDIPKQVAESKAIEQAKAKR
jgi:hypothetical protein